MEIIPTQKIVNRDGIKAVKNGQKANQYSSIPNQKKPDWIRVKASTAVSGLSSLIALTV